MSDQPLLPSAYQDRLTFDHYVSETFPVVKGTWVTTAQIINHIVGGYTWADILRMHPELREEDIETCLRYTVDQENERRIP